jgi:transposase
MRTLSLDLRERILSAYDSKEGTRDEIAARFRVSLGMVKKLLQHYNTPAACGFLGASNFPAETGRPAQIQVC